MGVKYKTIKTLASFADIKILLPVIVIVVLIVVGFFIGMRDEDKEGSIKNLTLIAADEQDEELLGFQTAFAQAQTDDSKFTIASSICYRYLQLGRYDAALISAEYIIETNPDNPLGYDYRGAVYEYNGNFNQAVRDYELAIDQYNANGDTDSVTRLEARLNDVIKPKIYNTNPVDEYDRGLYESTKLDDTNERL